MTRNTIDPTPEVDPKYSAEQPKSRYFKPAILAAMRRQVAEAAQARVANVAELNREDAQLARALTSGLADGTLTSTDEDNGTATIERADGSDLDLDALIEQYGDVGEDDGTVEHAEDDAEPEPAP